MLKIIRLEIFFILILLLIIFISNITKIDFDDYFLYYYKKFFQEIHLKKFFVDITILGDSLWYISLFVFSIIIFYLLKRIKFFNKYKLVINKFNVYNFLLFASVVTSGIIVQIIKHVLGRPRPNTFNSTDEIEFDFFTMDANFHSFPSGHTSTIFAVFLVANLIAPKLKYFFFLLAIIISFSRVAVGAHYITDIFGGIAVAFIGFKLSKLIVFKTLIKNNKINDNIIFNSNFLLVILSFLLLNVILAIGPTLDIFISDLFYLGKSHLGKNQFLVQSYYYISIFIREIFLGFTLVYILILPILSFFVPINKIYCGYNFKIKDIFFIWISTILSLIVFINLVLKNMWGRVRPNDILELGGTGVFTPWYQISNNCDSNCSFVSGDAAVGFSLVVFYFLIKNEIYLLLALFAGLIIGAIRVMEGGHFFSDIISSCILVFLFNYLIYLYYAKKING